MEPVNMTLINNLTKETALPRYSAAKKETLNTLMKDQVFEHAIRILETHGAEFLTLERLSNGIGVSRGTLYNYFADRNAIIEFVEERMFSPALAEMEYIAKGNESPTERLAHLIQTAIETLLKEPKIYFELSETHTKTRKRTEPQAKRVSRIHTTVKDLIKEGIKTGEFIAMPLDLSTTIVLGSMEGVIDELGRTDTKVPSNKIVSALLTVIMGGLTGGSYVGSWNKS
jgi:AcrR family transcriptional regulator